jgi:DNA-binding NarL/FixJ family response regulator
LNSPRIPIKVAIVEDGTGVRESLAIVLNGTAGFRCTGAYANAETALREIKFNCPDVVLMDINLPKMSGVECVAKLKAARPELHVLMLTICEDTQEIFDSLKAGASGYLLKETPTAEILEAVADVTKGGAPMSSQIARKLIQYFQKMGPDEEIAENLSKREIEVLTYLAKGYRYKEIADALSISALTVRSHLQRIYDKLHVRSRTEAVVKFLGSKQSA